MAPRVDHLLRAIERAATRLPRGLVLDLPGSSGRVRTALQPLGFDVVAGDLFHVQGSPIKGHLVKCDMSQPLPLRTASVAHAVSSEGIEHLPDAFAFLRELARVIRPGGMLILTTPNTLTLRARVAYMLSGQLNFRSALDEVSCYRGSLNDRIFHGHAFLRSYFQLRYVLHHAGFRVHSIEWVRLSPSSVLFSPLVPFIWLATARVFHLERRRFPSSPGREIRRQVLSCAMLYSKNLLLIAERVAA